MVITTTPKISRLGIEINAYVRRFPRNSHSVSQLNDKKRPYFGEGARLTNEELSEIKNWPDTVKKLITKEGGARAKDNFLMCIRSAIDPETSTERIVLKLIYQALSLGGLHCRKGGIFLKIRRDSPSNDIFELQAIPLRTFLLGAQKEMAEHSENLSHQDLDDYYKNIEVWANDFDYEGADDWYAEIAEIQDDLSSDAEDFARNKEEGWFYPDDDH